MKLTYTIVPATPNHPVEPQRNPLCVDIMLNVGSDFSRVINGLVVYLGSGEERGAGDKYNPMSQRGTYVCVNDDPLPGTKATIEETRLLALAFNFARILLSGEFHTLESIRAVSWSGYLDTQIPVEEMPRTNGSKNGGGL